MGYQRAKKERKGMNQYILIERIKVQNANAIAGFTWGFPAITHFLGFVHK
jgi:CRISPR-associated protein Csy2